MLGACQVPVKQFPVQAPNDRRLACVSSIPWACLNDAWAWKIHQQSLQRLAKRQGLSPQEIQGNVQRLSYAQICALSEAEAVTFVNALAAEKAPSVNPELQTGASYGEFWVRAGRRLGYKA